MPILAKTKVAEYSKASGGGYLNPNKIPTGRSVRFAIMPDSMIEYFETWGEKTDGKRAPVRFAEEPTPDDVEAAMVKAGLKLAVNKISEKPDVPKYVLALTVYEHDSGEIKVLALPQPSIRNQLEELDSKPDYEPITDWDLELSKKEEGGFVKYSLIALPRRRGQQASIDVAWEEAQDAGYDISRLIDGGDPFTAK